MVMHKVFGVERDIDIGADVFPSEKELAELEAPLGEHNHGWFDSCIEGAQLHYREFLPEGKPKGILIFMNGITSHSGECFMKSDGHKTNVGCLTDIFVKKGGFALYSFDNYGHGYSEGTRFFVPKYEDNVQDYLTFVQLVDKKTNGELPTFLCGCSYGGNLTIHVCRKIQDDPALGPKKFRGCFLMCPAIIGDLPPAPVYWFLRYILAPLFPKWTPFFMPNPISPDRIWSDPEVLDIHRGNPRMVEMRIAGEGEPFRLGTGLSLVIALDEARSNAVPGFNVPFYLLHGTCDYGVKIEGSEFMWRTVDTPLESREFKHVEGGYHDLLALKESYSLMEDVLKWMQRM